MKHSTRFNNAINKLYLAFHNNRLNPESCKYCAVGNILDQTDVWRHFSDKHGSLQLNYIGLVHQNLGRTFNGFTPTELLKIEAAFLQGCGYTLPYNNQTRRHLINNDLLFNGLCAVVDCLCELDHTPKVLDLRLLWQYTPQIKKIMA